jgi:hypothetical protein
MSTCMHECPHDETAKLEMCIEASSHVHGWRCLECHYEFYDDQERFPCDCPGVSR